MKTCLFTVFCLTLSCFGRGEAEAAAEAARVQKTIEADEARAIEEHLAQARAAKAADQLNSAQNPTLPHGELLLARSNCFACHEASDSLRARVQPLQAPDIADIGKRATPQWLQSWLRDPSSMRPGTHMPDLLLDRGNDAEQIALELTHYLVSVTGSFELDAAEVHPEDVNSGERLFNSLGCLPCHTNGFDDRSLASQYSVSGLADFLKDPLRVRPSGEMPDFGLNDNEAFGLSAWLLRDQLQNTTENLVPGLLYTYYENDSWPSNDAVDWSEHDPVADGSAQTVHEEYRLRKESYGLVFEGFIQAETAGDYFFGTVSDDGSELFIDGQRVVENLGMHAPSRKESEAVPLSKGQHSIRITYFEQGGGEELKASWSGPGFEDREFKTEDLWHVGQVPQPLNSDVFEVDPGLAMKGEKWFQELNCVACHSLNVGFTAQAAAKPWRELSADSTYSCIPGEVLSWDPPSAEHPPLHYLSSSQRASLRALLSDSSSLNQELTAEQKVQHGMQRLNCSACHPRGGIGGPAMEIQPAFTSTDDVGDEGRLPPDLTGSGAKFRAEWLRNTLANGSDIRPAMVTRMPGFGAESQLLAEALTEADLKVESIPSSFDPEIAKLGQQLVGNRGMSCIICHGVAGYPSTGVQGPDLADMYERLRPEWFHKWMNNPPAVRPGTRMPAFWFDGKSAITDVLEGHAAPQLDAIWQYMSLGKSMPLPSGLVVDRSSYDLAPQDSPIYFGTFMKGLSARVIAVGFPERVHLAFDADHVRLGMLWQGDFINAKGTWDGRAGQLESPIGFSVQAMPAGAAFAILDDPNQPWPEKMGKPADWRMKGHRRNPQGHPTFKYQHKDLLIEESLQPRIAPGDSGFVRSFQATAPQATANLYVRIAQASSIDIGDDPLDNVRTATTADGLRISISTPGALLRTFDGGQELLIPMVFHKTDSTFQAQATVKLTW